MVFGKQKIFDHMNTPANTICENDLIPDLTNCFFPCWLLEVKASLLTKAQMQTGLLKLKNIVRILCA